MKKFLTALIAAALLISSAGCQVQRPQATHSEPEPAPQAIVLNVDSPTDPSEKHIDMSAAIEQITAGLKVKVGTAEKKKEVTQATKEALKAFPMPSRKRHRNLKTSRKCGNPTPPLSQSRKPPPANRMPT